ncbi:MAG: phytanoyl-CoA dioxygenase family protein [Proteobacteria bacterium]|nr:phytanoyl-CoA dioxygenase family protein [Pseudomonadota bacterium]
MNSLNPAQMADYRAHGHLTVESVFSGVEMEAAIADAEIWAETEIAGLDAADRAWYVEEAVKGRTVLRKLDNPVYLRPTFRALAASPNLLALVKQIIGPDPRVLFSQLFFKAPGGGGPKPMHQDNYYFGPNDLEGMVTAWIALDDADESNGCLFFADGSNLGGVIPHTAPAGQPFNLLVPDEIAANYTMTSAPVHRGGVSFHHGTVLHQSSDNQSDRWRRACAIHYANGKTELTQPALTYDPSIVVAF